MTIKYLTINDIGIARIRASAISPFNLGIVEFASVESLNPVTRETGPQGGATGATGPRQPESDTPPSPPQRDVAPPTSPTTSTPRSGEATSRQFR